MLDMIEHQPPHFFSKAITTYTAFVFILLFGAAVDTRAQESSGKYSVIGIEDGDTLNVRSRPDENSSIVTKLPNGYDGITIGGEAVWNGSDDWVPIFFSNARGWVRPKYLSQQDDAIALNTDVPVRRAVAVNANDAPPSDEAAPSDWDTVSDDPYAWVKPATIIVGGIAALLIINDIFNGGDTVSQDESQARYEDNKAAIEYDRQRYQRSENATAISRGDVPPYPNAPH